MFLIQFKCTWLNWLRFRLKSAIFSYLNLSHLDCNRFLWFRIKIYVTTEGRRTNTESKTKVKPCQSHQVKPEVRGLFAVFFFFFQCIDIHNVQNSCFKSLHPAWGIFCFRRSHTLSGFARKALSCLHGGLFEVKTPWRELFVITQCWIDVSFQNDLFTWPPEVRFTDGFIRLG